MGDQAVKSATVVGASETSAREDWTVVDVFCGAGGLSQGFRRAGFRVVAGIDVDPACRYPFERNNRAKFVHASLDTLSAGDLAALYPPGTRRILVGCAPCAPFSSYTPEATKRRTDKWSLVPLFAERIMELGPDVVSMENVPRLVSFRGGEVFGQFVERLEEEYEVSVRVVDCTRYGVPQRRKRLVLLASKLGRLVLKAPTDPRRRPRTVREFIGVLPPISSGQVHSRDPLHAAAKLSNMNLRRIRASVPGGTWHDWPSDLVTRCHRKRSGKWYRNVYGRMAWDEPSPTITTGCFSYGRGRFGHPEQDRAISLREAALLQTFPPDYDFVPPGQRATFEHVGRQIGNAVPVAMGEAIAASVAEHVAYR